MESINKKTSEVSEIKREPVEFSIKTLMAAGAHFGHQTERWNPKMKPYLYGGRNGVHIINLDLTLSAWERTKKVLHDTVARGGAVLFVGTKPQAREAVEREARNCDAFFMTSRWLGGTLTNFSTIRKSLDRMKKLEDLLAQAEDESSEVKLGKKEKLSISRDLEKLNKSLGGIRKMKRAPDILVVIDVNRENIAVAEAQRLDIPVIALVDSNVDPEAVDFPIPANDDSKKTIELFVSAVADVVNAAAKEFEVRGVRPGDAVESSESNETVPTSRVRVARSNGRTEPAEIADQHLEGVAAG
jgi:small subunit ribosomal protein S2